MSLFLSALGLMMIFEGAPYFCAPSQVKIFAQKIGEVPRKSSDEIIRNFEETIQNLTSKQSFTSEEKHKFCDLCFMNVYTGTIWLYCNFKGMTVFLKLVV